METDSWKHAEEEFGAGQSDGSDHGPVERELAVFHGSDEVFVGFPVEIAEGFPAGEFDAEPALVGEEDQLGAVDFIVAGAEEVWVCEESGSMRFFDRTLMDAGSSRLCPGFPGRIELR